MGNLRAHGSVQTALFFDSMEPLVGRPVTADDVEPVTWATISRGRATAATRHMADVDQRRQFARAIVYRPSSLRRIRHANSDPEAAPPWLLRHV